MTVNYVRFGPGTFKLGTSPGTEFGCQVQSLGVNVDKDEGDQVTVLCGDTVPGSITYNYTLAGTLLQDFQKAGGITEYSWTHAGTAMAFEYVPTTAGATGAKIVGNVIIDPMSIGTSDGEVGDILTSDIEWSCVGKPTVTWGTGTLLMADESAAKEPANA